MTEDVRPRSALGQTIVDEMIRRRWSEAALARSARITRQYLRTILANPPDDDMYAKRVEPSPRILRQIAEGLTHGSRDSRESELVYAELMEAAGYMPQVLPSKEQERRVEEANERMRRLIEQEREESDRRWRKLLEDLETGAQD